MHLRPTVNKKPNVLCVFLLYETIAAGGEVPNKRPIETQSKYQRIDQRFAGKGMTIR